MKDNINWQLLTKKILEIGNSLNFNDVAICDPYINHNEDKYRKWVSDNFYGDMVFLKNHQDIKFNTNNILEQTKSIIAVRLDYLPLNENLLSNLKNTETAYIARYALGRDYHKTIKSKLKNYAKLINQLIKDDIGEFDFKYRACTDSAPVPEVDVAEKSGLGWRGKNTLLINKKNGSWFFLAEIYTNLPLIKNKSAKNHCGSCDACIKICPTKAIISPYKLDARKCISYLTIEHKGSIPNEYRRAIGNRIYGCDDCQIVCPWNKFAKQTQEIDFFVRHKLNNISLLECLQINKEQFTKIFSGSAVYRIGYEKWLSNVAIGLGNAKKDSKIISALKKLVKFPSQIVQDHVLWAIHEQESK
jgi:epoxyqueuosine reductase